MKNQVLGTLGLVLVAALTTVRPAHAEPTSFTLSVEAPETKVGAPARAKVKLVAGTGYHVNADYPTSLKLTPPAGVDLPKPTLSAKEAAIKPSEAQFDVAYTAKEAGKKTFSGILSFAVCTATTCDPHREKVTFTVDVR